jgi:hypothetical protein
LSIQELPSYPPPSRGRDLTAQVEKAQSKQLGDTKITYVLTTCEKHAKISYPGGQEFSITFTEKHLNVG